MRLISATFFWKNDQPTGLGFTFQSPPFTPEELQGMFFGPEAKKYMLESDKALGTQVVQEYLEQLEALGQMKARGQELSEPQVLLAALNIMWLTERGFIPQDEFNGTQYVRLG